MYEHTPLDLSRRELLVLVPAIVVGALSLPKTERHRSLTFDSFKSVDPERIAPDIVQIVTHGWDTPGQGGARYVFDQRVDRAYVNRFPRSAILASNGRGYRLASTGDARQFGARGDGRTDDSAAINEALALGGLVTLPGPATYYCGARLLLTQPNTQLKLQDSVTLRTRAWRYPGTQRPFGNAIHITADDCEVVGSGPDSVIENLGSDANGVGFLHCAGGRVANLTLRGGKSAVRAIADDTFQSGISIINDRGSNRSGRASGTTIENCTVTGWVHYGVNVYGNLASGIVLRGNTIVENGSLTDPLSTGTGIALTRGVGPLVIQANTISDNKGFGILVSSAGAQITGLSIIENAIVRNGQDGIRLSEQRDYGGTIGVGQRGVVVQGNTIESNRGAGVRAGTFDGVGFIADLSIERNRIGGNLGSGILMQANSQAGRGVDSAISDNELVANREFGIAVGAGKVTVRPTRNRFDGNLKGTGADFSSGSAQRLLGT